MATRADIVSQGETAAMMTQLLAKDLAQAFDSADAPESIVARDVDFGLAAARFTRQLFDLRAFDQMAMADRVIAAHHAQLADASITCC